MHQYCTNSMVSPGTLSQHVPMVCPGTVLQHGMVLQQVPMVCPGVTLRLVIHSRATLAVVSHFVSSSTPANHHHHHHHFIQHESELIFTSPKGLPSPLPCLLPFLPRACSSSHSSNFLPPSPPTQLLLPHPSSPTPLPHPTTPLGSHSFRPSSPPSCPYICLHLIPFPITILL